MAIVRGILTNAEHQYDKKKNPIWAWRAYAEARSAGLPIPDWVLGYFDDAVRNLGWLMQGGGELRVIQGEQEQRYPIVPPQKKTIAPALAAAFGFVPGGVEATERKNHHLEVGPLNRRRKVGCWNPFDDVDAEYTDLPIAVTVDWYLRGGSKPLYAYEDAAKEHHVSRRTVERAWAKHKGCFRSVAKK